MKYIVMHAQKRSDQSQRQLLHSAMYLIRAMLKDDYVLNAEPKVIKLMLQDAEKDIKRLNALRINSKLW